MTSLTFLLVCCVMVLAYVQQSIVRCSIHKIVRIMIQGLSWLLNAQLLYILSLCSIKLFPTRLFPVICSCLQHYSSPCWTRTPPLPFVRNLGLMAFTLALVEKHTWISLSVVICQCIVLYSSSVSNPLISYGCHFGHTIHTLANVKALITNGILHMGELADEPDEFFTAKCIYATARHLSNSAGWYSIRQRHEHHVFQKLLGMTPGLEEHLMNGSDTEVLEITEHVS